MLDLALPVLSFLSLFGALYILYKKISVLNKIDIESMQNRETFFEFLGRSFKLIFSYFSPKKIKIFILVIFEKILSRSRASTLKIHKTIEALSKDIKQKSQQEKWDHQWFSHDEKNKDIHKK